MLNATMNTLLHGTRPNIAMLFLDDHGWGDLGANVGGSYTSLTPELDRLAADGARLSDFHVGASVCTPSRAALLTGRYGMRTGVIKNFAPGSKYGFPETELTIADVLRDAGYSTAMIGKWHLGHNEPHHPTYRGFDSWFGLPYSGDMGCLDTTPQSCYGGDDRTQGTPSCPALCPDDAGHGGCGVSGGTAEGGCVAIPLYDTHGRNCGGAPCSDSIVEQPYDPFMLNTRYAARAREVISMNAPPAPPLFLYVAFAHTHTPLTYEARWNRTAGPGHHSPVFASTLAEVDWAVGEIRKAADVSGAPWLIWVSADNGPADLAMVNCDSVGDPGPYVGSWQRSGGGGGGSCKGTTWEGGHRVIGLAYWRGTIDAGRTIPDLTGTVDLLPTFAALAGAPLAKYGRAFDGIDLSPALVGAGLVEDEDRILFHPNVTGALDAMRVGKYKIFFESSGARDGCFYSNGSHRWPGKENVIYHDPPLVFDLDADPGEATPLTSAPPDVLARAKAARAAKLANISKGLRSNVSYELGGSKYWPCSNRSSACCRLSR